MGPDGVASLEPQPSQPVRLARRAAAVIQMRDAWIGRSRAEAHAVYGPHAGERVLPYV